MEHRISKRTVPQLHSQGACGFFILETRHFDSAVEAPSQALTLAQIYTDGLPAMRAVNDSQALKYLMKRIQHGVGCLNHNRMTRAREDLYER